MSEHELITVIDTLQWRNEKRGLDTKAGMRKKNPFREAPCNPNLRASA